MIELPNELWIRSTKMPEWAICLDPDDRFFGWKMFEHPDGRWVSGGALSREEVIRAKEKPELVGFIDELDKLLVRIEGES